MGDLYRDAGQSTADGAHRHALSRDQALRAMLARGRSCVPNTGCCRRPGVLNRSLPPKHDYRRIIANLRRIVRTENLIHL